MQFIETLKMIYRSQAGFTLVEILVALTVLTVIGTIAIPNFRQFNSDQEQTNTTSSLIRLLQQAQSSSQSQIACINSQPLATNNPAIFWDLQIFKISGVTNYQLQAECINGATGVVNNPPVTVYETDSLKNVTLGVTYNTASSNDNGCSVPALIKFYTTSASTNGNSPPPLNGQVVQLSCNGGPIVPNLTQVVLNIAQSGFTTQKIIIESNGVVHQ